eukprot:Awhi_evm1s7407
MYVCILPTDKEQVLDRNIEEANNKAFDSDLSKFAVFSNLVPSLEVDIIKFAGTFESGIPLL